MIQRTLVRIPGQEEKRTTTNITSTPAHPSVKRVPGLVLGEQSTPTVSHCTTNGSSGTTGCPHRQWEAWLVPPASSLPGLQGSTGTSYLLSAQVPWLVQERVTFNRQREALLCFAFALCVCVCVCKPDDSDDDDDKRPQQQPQTDPQLNRVMCTVCHRSFRRESDKKRHKCLDERSKPISKQKGAVQCSSCLRWFASKGGFSVHRCPRQ